MNLKKKLEKAGKTRWLEVGCGENFEEGFHYLDVLKEISIPKKHREKYFSVNIASPTAQQLKRLGKFDLVRMQHVLEHFTLEDGQTVLKNCAKLLKPGGVILISVPDLKIHAEQYMKKQYLKWWPAYKEWAEEARIPTNSPQSFYFSLFTHSLPDDPHLWCYDYEGLAWQMKHVGYFKDIREITLKDPLALVPFTHNRAPQDLCVMAIRK